MTTATSETAKLPAEHTFPQMLKLYQAQIAAALPKHISAERMARIALTAYHSAPKLAQCTPRSIFAAVVRSAQLGLEVGLNGQAFLVPYKNTRANRYEAQFIPGWKGLVDLAHRTGRSSCWTGAVYAGDEIDYQLGSDPFIHHRPGPSLGDEKDLRYVYAVGRVADSKYPIIEVWPIEKVERHRDRYNKVGEDHYSFSNWELYARKVPLLQVLKYLPSSPELTVAIAAAYAEDTGKGDTSLKNAIEGVFAPGADDDEDGDKGNGKDKSAELRDRARSAAKFTPADVDARIEAAKTPDELDAALDLVKSLPEAEQQKRLDAGKAKRETLKAK